MDLFFTQLHLQKLLKSNPKDIVKEKRNP